MQSKPPNLAPGTKRGNLEAAFLGIGASKRRSHRRPTHWRSLVLSPHTPASRIEKLISLCDLDALVILHDWLIDRRVCLQVYGTTHERLSSHASRWGVADASLRRICKRMAIEHVRDQRPIDIREIATEVARAKCLELLKSHRTNNLSFAGV